MNGPDVQNLDQVITSSFQFGPESEEQELQASKYILSKKSLTTLDKLREESKMTFRLRWFELKPILGGTNSETIRGSEPVVVDAGDSFLFDCKIFANDILALGFFCTRHTNSGSGLLKKTLRLLLFHYKRASNQLQQVSDEEHPIDETYLSHIPLVSDEDQVQLVSFVEHKKRVFCMAYPHMSKPVIQIFCLHRHRFVAIGGTNCNRRGLYVMDRHTENRYFYRNEKFCIPFGYGQKTTTDLKREIVTHRHFEWKLSF